MATTTPTVGPAWSLLVASGLEFGLSLHGAEAIRLRIDASTPAATDPSRLVRGDSGGGQSGVTRAITGPGNLYSRTDGPTITVALDTWS